jgi:transcriptional regulator with XRE-family HTH domain
MAKETIGARIQRIAKERDKGSGKALAAALGVTYEALRQWTTGKGAPNRQRAQNVAEFLGVTLEVLLFGDGPSRQPDAEALADAFDALPVDTPQALATRQVLYASIMGSIGAHAQQAASAPTPAPAAPPTRAPARDTETPP